jgi:hypothetical protein
MTKLTKAIIKTKVSTQTAIIITVVALAAFGIASFGYGIAFRPATDTSQRAQIGSLAPDRTKAVLCKSAEFYWPYPGKTFDEVKKQLGYKDKWNDGEDVLFYRAWLRNTNVSPTCDLKIERMGVISGGSINGATNYRLMRVLPGDSEELLSVGGSVIKTGATLPPNAFVLASPVVISAGSNMEFTIRAVDPKDAKSTPDYMGLAPSNITHSDGLDRAVEWGLSTAVGPTSTAIY